LTAVDDCRAVTGAGLAAGCSRAHDRRASSPAMATGAEGRAPPPPAPPHPARLPPARRAGATAGAAVDTGVAPTPAPQQSSDSGTPSSLTSTDGSR